MKRLALLDYGRFFAAITVIAFHYTFNGIANGKVTSISHVPYLIDVTKYGYLGVELFFMISGYVIFFSAKNRSAADFAISRAVRLYPAYWFAILFTSFFALRWGGDLMSVSPGQIIVNFTMIQSYLDVGHVDGVYWTLVYELTFYLAVFVMLFVGLQKHLNSIFIYWPALFCVAFLLNLQSVPYLGGYYYYFAAGALFAVLASKFQWRALVSLLMTFALCISFSVDKAVHLSASKGTVYSPVVIGSIITFIFILFVWQNSKKGRALNLPMSRLAGALTYPVYLIHAHFGYMILNRYATDENKVVVYLLTIATVLLIAFGMHYLIETRLHSVWKNLFESTLGRFLRRAQEMPRRIQLAYGNRD